MCFYHFQKQNSTCKCCSSEVKLLWVLNLVLCSCTSYTYISLIFFHQTSWLWIIIKFFVMYVGVSRNARSHIDYEKNVLFQEQIRKANSSHFYSISSTTMYCRCTFLIRFYYCCCLEQPFRNLWSSDKQMKKNSTLFLLTLLYIYKDIHI